MTLTYLGRPFHVHPPRDYVSDVLRRTGEWEPEVIRAVSARVRRMEPGTVIDVGAMIGTHAVAWAVTLPQHVVHAFEPSPANLALLRRNADGLPNLIVHPTGLSDFSGSLQATTDPDNLGHTAIAETDPWPMHGTTVSVMPVTTLDSFHFRDVRAIKIDVEWHEPRVLAGGRATIERDRPLIVIEDWADGYGELMPDGYVVLADWKQQHQTRLYGPA